MDISETLAPRSEQMDACELTQPTIFTVARVTKGASEEQPVQVFFEEFPRPWRPSKSMRRVLAACWTPQSAQWSGRRIELFCDSSVKFGGIEVGGIRVSRISHIDGPKKIPLLITRGKSAMFVVEPLAEAPAKNSLPDRIAGAIERFATIGVGIDRLETRVGRPRAEWTTPDVADLGAAWLAIERGETTLEDQFPQPAEDQAGGAE